MKPLDGVGKNLKDHVMSSVLVKLNDSVGIIDARTVTSVPVLAKALYDFVTKGKGTLPIMYCCGISMHSSYRCFMQQCAKIWQY